MADPRTSYDALLAELREIALLSSVGSLLRWDEQTQMPPKGGGHRAEQVSLIARLFHERLTSPRMGEFLDGAGELLATLPPDADEAVNVREVRREYERQRKLPAALVEELSKTSVLGQQAWAEARAKSDFSMFRPWLEKTVELKRQEAACIGAKSGDPYDALLDEYEPGESASNIERVFEELRPALVELIRAIGKSPRKAPIEILSRHYPASAQEKLAREAVTRIGFDFTGGRLDASVHPFCQTIGPGDTRMTTRYDEQNFGDAFFSVLHEAGHGMYFQGLPSEHFGTPRGDYVSSGIHESQSRLWENLVGRSRAFWRWCLPRARTEFGQALSGVSDDDWHFAINDVRPSLIRTDADETTYNLHVMLRFELERALLSGSVSPADLPAAWNDRMRDYLGLTPPDDAQGCLQDIHWSSGAFGYFPTYTLGNLYAAQFFDAARRDLGDLDSQFAAGEFNPLLGWLRRNIHAHGKRYSGPQLVEQASGEPLSARPLLGHLRRSAAELYGV